MLLRRAHEADPHFLPAEIDYVQALADRVDVAERRRLLLAGVTDSVLARCLDDAIATPGHAPAVVATLASLARRAGATPCTRAFEAEWSILGYPITASTPPAFNTWLRAVGPLAADAAVWIDYANVLRDAGDGPAAERVLETAGRRVNDWRGQLLIALAHADLRDALGDTVGARAIREALAAAAARDGRPGVELDLVGNLLDRARDVGARDSLARLAVLIARRAHARGRLVDQLEQNGGTALDRGNVADAVRWLAEAAPLADSLGWRPLRSRAHTLYGRALLKDGRSRSAIRELDIALTVVDPDDQYQRASVHHNLAHAYESLGDLDAAVREVRTFAALATPMRQDGLAIISRYDAGLIEWEAGLHASSRNSFEQMVRFIDEQHAYYYYAGDYYERIGDLARARAYYARVRDGNSEEGARALAGLTRTFEALGMLDSAEAAARRHDMAVATPGDVPLLPEVLARRGRFDDARAATAAWLARQGSGGGVERAARVTTQLARMLLDAGVPTRALAQARRAERMARSSALVEERARALDVEADALLAAGQPDAAVRVLSAAATAPSARWPADLAVELHHSRGRALAACGRTAEALREFDAAAQGVDHMASSFDEDLDRVRLRAAQLASFDDAIRLLASARGDGRAAALLAWSERRKEAAYPGETSGARILTLTEIRARLAPTAALVDYVLVDSLALAIVVTPERASVVRLPATSAGLTSAIHALRQPMAAHLGQVDLTRLTFDRARAAALYAALVAPVAPHLGAATRLIIVPDGVLHLLPFDALLERDAADARFMIDRYEITYLPSARFLAGPAPRRFVSGGAASLLFVGYDAAGDTAEWQGVAREWPRSRARSLLGRGATKSAVVRAAARASVLHVAAEAHASAADPLATYLRLAPAGADDGLLHVSEIERMHVDAGLVVLSACETDDGLVLRGAGPLGIARAFLVAGAQAVMGTEWPVSERVADLTPVFYARLMAGATPSAALRAAQLATKARSATSNPFYWAGFTLVER